MKKLNLDLIKIVLLMIQVLIALIIIEVDIIQ